MSTSSPPPDDIPAAEGSLPEILVCNTLEYYTPTETERRLLPHWVSRLAPQGRLVIIADDGDAAVDRLRDGQTDLEELNRVVYSGTDPHGRPRRSLFGPRTLRQLLANAGLQRIAVIDRYQSAETEAYTFRMEGYQAAVRPLS